MRSGKPKLVKPTPDPVPPTETASPAAGEVNRAATPTARLSGRQGRRVSYQTLLLLTAGVAFLTYITARVRNNMLPPASSYPKVSDGTLVSLDKYVFPAIPGVSKPHEATQAYRLDYGQDWQKGILSVQPPRVGTAFPVLVPQVDADGNELAGIRLPEVTVPLATYTGWNLRDASIGAPEQRIPFEGSYLPFPKTAGEQKKAGDPRKSIADRYASRDDFMKRYAKAVDELVRERWILPEDRETMLLQGENEWAQATAK
jgi:hypothetical protein